MLEQEKLQKAAEKIESKMGPQKKYSIDRWPGKAQTPISGLPAFKSSKLLQDLDKMAMSIASLTSVRIFCKFFL